MAWEATADRLTTFVNRLAEIGDVLMTLLDDTKATIAQLVTDVNTAISEIQAGSTSLHQQIDALKAQIAAGGAVTAADLQGLHDSVAAIDTTVKTASANLQAANPPVA